MLRYNVIEVVYNWLCIFNEKYLYETCGRLWQWNSIKCKNVPFYRKPVCRDLMMYNNLMKLSVVQYIWNLFYVIYLFVWQVLLFFYTFDYLNIDCLAYIGIVQVWWCRWWRACVCGKRKKRTDDFIGRKCYWMVGFNFNFTWI